MPNSLSFEDLRQSGREHLKAGRLHEAVSAFEKARLINDLDPDLHDGLATAHYMLKSYETAAKHFERVTRLDPRRGSAWVNLGAVYNRMGNHQKAAEVLRRAVQIEKKSGIAFYNLGIAYKHLKQWNLAVPAYREAIRLEPRMADAYLNLGNVYCEMGNYAQAITHYKKALDINPDLDRAVRGLEKAEARANASRPPSSPFGRLVDPDAPPPASEAHEIVSRELTVDERIHDRHVLNDLAAQLQIDLEAVLEALSGDLEPAVRTLNKMLTQALSPHGVSITKAEALEDFIAARAKYLPRLAQLKTTLRLIREHEAQMT